MIVIDTLGTGHLGSWNPVWTPRPISTPWLRMESALPEPVPTAPWTQPAVASLMTGLTPSRHGVLHLFDKLPDDQLTLAEALAKPGAIETAGVVSHFLINREQGFGQGFEVYTDASVKGQSRSRHQRSPGRRSVRCGGSRTRDFSCSCTISIPTANISTIPQYDRTSRYQGPARQWDRDILKLARKTAGDEERRTSTSCAVSTARRFPSPTTTWGCCWTQLETSVWPRIPW